MPIYVYECAMCGTREEHMRKIEDRDKPILCRGVEMKRVVTPVHGRVDTPADGSKPKHYGGPDQFTADAMGIPKKELLTDPRLSGLRNDGPGKI